MNTNRDPRELTIDLLPRSNCRVKVTATIADKHGIFGWGWNSAGSGFGEHAEAAAIRRSNKKRLAGATIFVASERLRNGKIVGSKPCPDCQALIDAWGLIAVYRDKYGDWIMV